MEKREIEIELAPEVSNGIFSNLTMISHTESEFFFDFIFISPQENKGRVRARIIMSPIQAKRFLAAFQENIRLFEEKEGEMPSSSPPPAPRYLT